MMVSYATEPQISADKVSSPVVGPVAGAPQFAHMAETAASSVVPPVRSTEAR